MSSLQPLSSNERDASLDILRGFALAGVLLTFCITDVRSAPGYTKTFLDELVDWPKYILIENRMYTMLIIIFGIGFHIQLKKAQKKNVSFVPVFLRRVLALTILGFLHAILLSTRDVLMFYGIAGAVLLLLRNAKNWQLWALIAFIFFILAPVIARIQTGFSAFKLPQPNNYADHVQHNWQFFKLYHQIYFIYFEMLFHFMFGYLLSKSGIFQKIKENKKLRRKLMVISLAGSAIMIPALYFYFENVVYPLFRNIKPQWVLDLAIMGVRTVWQVWMIVSVTLYATVLISIYRSAKGKKWVLPLAAFGQMSLSNYLIQSIILVPYLLAFNKYDNMPPFNGFILFLVVLSLQLVFSAWWMTRYALGPFEWLLRSFTYWRWQKIKRSQPLPQQIKIVSI